MASGPSSGRAVRYLCRYMAAAAFGAVVVLGAGWAYGAAGAAGVKAGDDKPPIVVTAKSLFADNKKKVVIYQKNVVVKRADVTLYADQVTVHLVPSDKAGAASDQSKDKGKDPIA